MEPEAGGHDGKDAGGGVDTSETELASDLSRLEIYVGIRAEQMNAWRDYTAALQELLAPRRKLEGLDEASPFGSPGPKHPFDREQKLAEEVSRRGQVADRLMAAIAALRTTLTPPSSTGSAWADRSKWLRIPHGSLERRTAPTERRDASPRRSASVGGVLDRVVTLALVGTIASVRLDRVGGRASAVPGLPRSRGLGSLDRPAPRGRRILTGARDGNPPET